jgi:hypothetical protein
MFGLLIIATTLLTRGVNNMQEMAFLVMAPQVSLANYTYHYLESTGFNYTELANTIPAMSKELFSRDFSLKSWMNPTTVSTMRNTTEYWMKDIPSMATELPAQMYERLLSVKPRYTSPKVDLGMLFVSMYLATLFMMAAAVWIFKPGSVRPKDDFDSDNILARKRKRLPAMEDRMQLRSMTTDDDVFYELE